MKQLRMLEEISRLLRHAGEEIILPAWEGSLRVETKSDGSNVTETDLACQHFIENGLQQLDPDIAFLGEEMHETDQLDCLASGAHYWCVDPLDGTSNFIAGIPAFASSVALIEHGEPVVACIHDPVRGETFSAIKGGGATLNGHPLKNGHTCPLAGAVGFVDFKRLPRELAIRFATERLYRSQRNIGSCALEWAWLAAGRGQFIVHGGEKLWDFSGGSILAAEAGCIVSDFDGSALFPCHHLTSPIIAAANPTIHQQLLGLL